jgi:hypothetical protein
MIAGRLREGVRHENTAENRKGTGKIILPNFNLYIDRLNSQQGSN